MKDSTIRFSTFPRTEPPPGFVEDVVGIFRQHEGEISTETNAKGLKSDEVLTALGTDLAGLGFQSRPLVSPTALPIPILHGYLVALSALHLLYPAHNVRVLVQGNLTALGQYS